MQIQSGSLMDGKGSSDWNLYENSGDRSTRIHINFPKTFAQTPTVAVSLSEIDILNGANIRLKVSAESVDADGFELVFLTWADTKVWSAQATWIAFGE